MNYEKELEAAILAGGMASKRVIELYKEGFEVYDKPDGSPVTSADLDAHEIITEILEEKTHLPIISEEGEHYTPEIRRNWPAYWCVDPIDGTRDFVQKTDEFCICLGLLDKGFPVVGVLFAPALGGYYFGAQGIGAFRFMGNLKQLLDVVQNEEFLQSLMSRSEPLPRLELPTDNYIFLQSRNHLDSDTEAYRQRLSRTAKVVSKTMGSAIKSVWVTEGRAHEYTRMRGANYWDVLAGDAIARAAGLVLRDAKTGSPMQYPSDSLRVNGYSVVNQGKNDKQAI